MCSESRDTEVSTDTLTKNNTGDRNIECQKLESKYVKLFKYVIIGMYSVLYILDIGIL